MKCITHIAPTGLVSSLPPFHELLNPRASCLFMDKSDSVSMTSCNSNLCKNLLRPCILYACIYIFLIICTPSKGKALSVQGDFHVKSMKTAEENKQAASVGGKRMQYA